MHTTIRVWTPHLAEERGEDDKKTNMGHASLEIGNTYISWWPAEGQNNPGTSLTLAEDNEQESAKHLYTSPPITGLDAAKISAWWNKFSNNPKSKWLFDDHNCSWTVMKALERGGACSYKPFRLFYDGMMGGGLTTFAPVSPYDCITAARILTGKSDWLLKQYGQYATQRVSNSLGNVFHYGWFAASEISDQLFGKQVPDEE